MVALGLDPTDLTDDVAIMRARLHKLLKADPDHVALLIKGIGQLARIAATHYHLSGPEAASLTDAMHNILTDIETTLGKGTG